MDKDNSDKSIFMKLLQNILGNHWNNLSLGIAKMVPLCMNHRWKAGGFKFVWKFKLLHNFQRELIDNWLVPSGHPLVRASSGLSKSWKPCCHFCWWCFLLLRKWASQSRRQAAGSAGWCCEFAPNSCYPKWFTSWWKKKLWKKRFWGFLPWLSW